MGIEIEVRRIGSLYSGIAGLELGVLAAFAEAGLPARITWQCEIDPFCSRVLAHHFPNVQRFSDVATVSYPPNVDVLCGGFACQDVSSAGKGAGLGKETRSGFTLHHLLRIIDEIQPRFLAIENVASGAKRWLPRVVQELVDRGYRPRAVPLGAIDVGAPHRRLRIFVVADTDGAAQRWIGGVRDGERAALGHDARGRGEGALPETERGTPQSGVGGDAHGLPFDVAGHAFPAGRGEAQYAWEAPRAVGGDVKVPDRPAKLRALGNAVVPQCGLVVGRVLVAMGA